MAVQTPSFMGFVDTWGERLLKATFIYSILSLIFYISLASSGYQPPPVVPPIVSTIYTKAIALWSSMSGQVYSGSSTSMLISLFNSIQSVFMLLFGIMFNSAITFIWIGILAVELIPPPFTVFKIIVVIVAAFAQMILVLYLIKSVASVISNYLPVMRFG